MFLSTVAAGSEYLPTELAYWDLFTGKVGAAAAGAALVVALWVLWSLLGIIALKGQLGTEAARPAVPVFLGLIAVASAVYMGLVLMVP